MCGNMVCAAGSVCCTSSCGGTGGEALERRDFCAQGGCLPVPGVVIPCNPCTQDSDCRIVDNSCADPVSSCQCRARTKAAGDPSSCSRCDPQACANKIAVCMIAGNPPVPVPVPVAGFPPQPPKPQGICVVRDAPRTMP